MARKPSAAKKEATRLHSKIVRARGRCENCGAVEHLQCAHVISRRYSATRTDEWNAFCLCAGCHMHFTEHPVEFADFVTEHLGRDWYDHLYRRAHAGRKVDWEAECERLREIWDQISAPEPQPDG